MEEDIRLNILDVEQQLSEAAEKLKGANYSRMLLSVQDIDDMEHIEEFYDTIYRDLDERMGGQYYLIGDSSMSYEMSHTFGRELTTITILTAVAIFIVVTLTFRNVVLPAILVLLVQTGVYITVSMIGLQGSGLYYLTLLMVECILMGSTIDIIYHYFPGGKQEIFRQIVEERMKEVIDSLSGKNSLEEYMNLPLEEALERILVNFMGVVEENLDILRILFKEDEVRGYMTHEELMRLVGDKDIWFHAFLKRKAEKGEVRDMDFECASMTVRAIVMNHVLEKVFHGGPGRLENPAFREKMIRHHADLWRAG